MASVLVVDDEPDIGVLVEAVPARSGHRVRVAGDGAAALALTMAEPPDLVIIDLDLGGEDGLDVLACILRRAPTAGAVLMAGHRRPARTPPAVQSLDKPFTLGALVGVVEEALAIDPPNGGQ